MNRFYSNGKLLLSGEYLILDGASGLALPTRLGQEMIVSTGDDHSRLSWKSLDKNGVIWFEVQFSLPKLELMNFKGSESVALTLQRILRKTQKANASFLRSSEGIQVTTKLQFERNWGLGSSSTLINNIAQWSETDAFDLLFSSFGGSGYDIACAGIDRPLIYTLDHGKPHYETVTFDPSFKEQLYFVHLNRKQISSDSIKQYKKKKVPKGTIKIITDISKNLLSAPTIEDFNKLLKEHELIMADILETETIQQKLFPDFQGQLKSLGAWGGDFILASGDPSTMAYFQKKGFQTVVPYQSMIKS